MRKKAGILPFLVLGCQVLFGQTLKSADMAVIAFVKNNSIQLRWAPANVALWKAGNKYGYKVERILYDNYMSAAADSTKFKNATAPGQQPLLPWPQDDPRWKELAAKNKAAAFVHGNLYMPDTKATQQKKEMAFGMLMKSCDLYKELSTAHGLSLTDSSFTKNEVYVYRISLYNPPKHFKYSPALVKVDPKEISSLPEITSLKAKFGDKRVVLSYVTKDVSEYAGYWIERSEDSLNYKVVNTSPFIRTSSEYDKDKKESLYADSLPVNNKKFYYRVRGISCFGETGPASNIVSGKGKPDLKEYPLIDSVVIVKNAAVLICFHMPASFDKSLLAGYCVFRNETKNGKYSCIAKNLDKGAGSFMDEQPKEANYYKVCVINSYGDSAYSLISYAKLIDETPPAVPAAPTGTIDSNGVVKITWSPNTDKDLLGYRVYRCNSEGEQPFELTKKLLTQNSFTDTVSLKTLTREVYYALRAVDKVYNNSTYSKYCKLIRPDKIAPVAVVFSQVTPTDSSVILKWHNSSSNDVKHYKLYKKENSLGWKLLREWPADPKTQQAADTSLKSGNTYQYKIEVWDGSGNSSRTESHTVLFKPLFEKKIQELKFKVDREQRSIELQWTASPGPTYNYTLYKSKANEPLRAFKTLGAKSNFFIDKELYPGNKYRYAIKATLKSGAETKLSDVIEVEF